MIKYTDHRIKRPHKAFVGLLYALILVLGLSFVFLPKTAYSVSARDYYDVVSFSGDPTDNSATLTIQVKTSFSIQYKRLSAQAFCYPTNVSYQNKTLFTISDTETGLWSSVIDPFSILENGVKLVSGSFCWDATNYYAQFGAGKTYEFKLTKNRSTDGSNLLGVWSKTYYNSNPKGWFYLNVGDHIEKLFYNSPLSALYDPAQYQFLPIPTIQVAYPQQNDEIAEAFYIQGTYDAQDLNAYPIIYIWLQYQNNDIYPFIKELESTTGILNERISGLPSGEYDIRFIFAGGTGWWEIPDKISINVVETIPIELPETQETPPDFFNIYDLDYSQVSEYDQPTDLLVNLINAVKPLFIVIGDNLTFFSSRFDQDIAKETGEKTAQAVLLFRSYSSNLNSFFNDLPISEFLLFYLTLLIVVIVFRIIKNLINLIKP